jgi:hypothetical protein
MALVVATWRDFADTDPDFASFGLERLSRPVAYLGTIRRNGAPRVHPVTAHIADGVCFIYMEPASPKAIDLERDHRYALHCSVEDDDGGNGEFGIRGSATKIEDTTARSRLFEAARIQGFHPEDHHVLFELTIEIAFSTTYDNKGLPQRKVWKPNSTSSPTDPMQA